MFNRIDFNRNLGLLFFAQLLFVSGTVVLVTVSGIVGSALSPNPNLATLPVSLMVVGTALATVPAALLMQRIGRRWGFVSAAALAVIGALTGAFALSQSSFLGFCLATGTIGATLAFSQQFRFAAAESVKPEQVSYAISFLLLGSVGGAIVAPEIIARSQLADAENPYQRAMLLMAALYGIALILMLGLRNLVVAPAGAHDQPARKLSNVVRQPLFIVAVLAGMVGHGAMTYIMTATPLSMHVGQQFELNVTAEVIRAHVIAMYLPSLISAPLIGWLGTRKLMMVGVFAMLATLGIGLAGQHLLHYWWALVILGIGWNFLYIGGTTLLVRTYRPNERFSAQAVNEFSVFSISALASLLAGSLLYVWGWNALLLTALPLLLLMLVLILWSTRTQTNAATASSNVTENVRVNASQQEP